MPEPLVLKWSQGVSPWDKETNDTSLVFHRHQEASPGLKLPFPPRSLGPRSLPPPKWRSTAALKACSVEYPIRW